MHEAYNVSCIHIVSVLLLCDAPDIVVGYTTTNLARSIIAVRARAQ